MARCPTCGEFWDDTVRVCTACFWFENTHIRPPNWWKQCVANEHETNKQTAEVNLDFIREGLMRAVWRASSESANAMPME